MTNDRDDTRQGAQLSRDPETIRQWADEHDAVPVRETTGGAGERYRMVPESAMTEEQERVEWDAFFDDIESGEDVVVYHGAGADEPFRVTGHSDVSEHVDDAELEERLLDGETVTTDITETRVVESVVVEELTVESELVGSEIVDDRVVDAQMLDLDCIRCDLEESEGVDVQSWFDTERYLEGVGDVGSGLTTDAVVDEDAGMGDTTGTTGGTTGTTEETTGTAGDTTGTADATGTAETGEGVTGTGSTREGTHTIADATGTIAHEDEFPYRADLEVEETWAITREFEERHTVASEIVDSAVTEADTIEDYDIDVSALHRQIVDQGIFETEHEGDEVLTHYDAQSEVGDGDRIHTTFTRERRVEDEIVDRKRLDATMTGGQYLGMDLLQTRTLDAEPATGAAPSETTGAMDDTTGTTGTTTTGETTAGAGAAGAPEITDDLVGHTVRNAEGDSIGMVSDVEPEADQLYVDVDPSVTERVATALGWGDHDEEDFPLGSSEVRRVTDDEVWLKGAEEIEESGERIGRAGDDIETDREVDPNQGDRT